MNDQLNLFAQSKQEYKINKPIRLIELFGGIGSQANVNAKDHGIPQNRLRR